MRKKSYPLIIALIGTIGSTIIAYYKKKLTFGTISDYLFLFTLFFLIIGVGIGVLASGFFDFFQQSMRTTFARKKKRNLPYMKFSEAAKNQYQFWLITAVCLFLCSLLFLALSYL